MLLFLLPGFWCFAELAEAQPFKVRIPIRIETVDWHRSPTTSDAIVMNNIMEGLFEFDPRTGARPVLAKSYSISADRKTYTFKLKPNVKWSDGRLLRAQDFVDSWQRLLDPATGSPYLNYLGNVVGAQAFSRGETHDFSTVKISAPDPETLVVELKMPCDYFIQMLTLWATFPIRIELVRQHGLNSWTDPDKLVTLGPYRLAAMEKGARYVLKPNPLYHDAGGTLESIEIEVNSDDEKSVKAFKNGTFDLVLNPTQAQEHLPGYHAVPLLRTRYLAINTTRYPLSLPNVRQAVAMSIDVSALPAAIHKSSAPATSFVPPEIFGRSRSTTLPFDPVQAKKLIADSGLLGRNFPHIEFVGIADDETTLMLNEIKRQLKANLDVESDVQMVTIEDYRMRIGLGAGSIFAAGWGADYADPDSFLSVFLSDAPTNSLHWKNVKFDDLVRKGAYLQKGNERDATYQSALELLQRTGVAIIPAYYQRTVYLLNPARSSIEVDPLGVVHFQKTNRK